MPVEGAIAERTRGIIPVTWDALMRDPRFGDGSLQSAVNVAKESVTGQLVAPTAEGNYPLVVIDYIAKVAAIEICNAGIDFWMNEPLSESASGTNENHSFTERASTLRQLRQDLIAETRQKAGEIADLLGYRRARKSGFPRSNTIDEPFITPSPLEFPRPYAPTGRT